MAISPCDVRARFEDVVTGFQYSISEYPLEARGEMLVQAAKDLDERKVADVLYAIRCIDRGEAKMATYFQQAFAHLAPEDKEDLYAYNLSFRGQLAGKVNDAYQNFLAANEKYMQYKDVHHYGRKFLIALLDETNGCQIFSKLQIAVQSSANKKEALSLAQNYLCAGEHWMRKRGVDFCNEEYTGRADRIARLRGHLELDHQLAHWGWWRSDSSKF